MRVDISTRLPCPAETAARHVKTPALHGYVSRPLLTFVPRSPDELPEVWSEGTYRVSMYLLGKIPLGRQAIVISFPEAEDTGFCVRDNGHGGMARKWDHWVTIRPAGGGCIYRDRVDVEAGPFTPLVWGFAQLFYRYRQFRWRKLVKKGFQY